MNVGAADVEPRLILADLRARTLREALAEMVEGLSEVGAALDPSELTDRLLEREQLGCTGLGGGVAIPHCKWKGIRDVVFAIGRSRAGIDFGAPDGVPVTLIFLLLSPVDAPGLHLQALARISRRLKVSGVAEHLRGATTAEELSEIWKDRPVGLLEANA